MNCGLLGISEKALMVSCLTRLIITTFTHTDYGTHTHTHTHTHTDYGTHTHIHTHTLIMAHTHHSLRTCLHSLLHIHDHSCYLSYMYLLTYTCSLPTPPTIHSYTFCNQMRQIGEISYMDPNEDVDVHPMSKVCYMFHML